MKHREYEEKLTEWESEGYDVSDLRKKWSPPHKAEARSRKGRWLSIGLLIVVVVAAVVVWQVWSASTPTLPVEEEEPAPIVVEEITPVTPEITIEPIVIPPQEVTVEIPPAEAPTEVITPAVEEEVVEVEEVAVSVSPPGSGSVKVSIRSPDGLEQSYEVRTTDTQLVDAGSTVTLAATASTCYRFDHWSGDVSGTSSTVTVTMDSNKHIVTNFSKIIYSLTTSVNPSGSGSIDPSNGNYDCGESVTLTATASTCYRFDYWSGDVSGTSSTVTVTMDSNKHIVANFSKIIYSLTTSVNPSGSGSIDPSNGTYDCGESVTLSATSSSGYQFDQWSGTDDNYVNPTTVTMTDNKSVTVYFVAADTDGDGLTDLEEQQIGTNPSYADTDHDGLNDYEEVKVTNTDPLNPDTDGDGFKDGDDLFPFYDAYVRVSIKYFEDTCAWGVSADTFDFGDPFFKIWVGSLLQTSNIPVQMDVSSMQNPFSSSFNVPDHSQFVSIKIEVWDYELLTGNEQYDCGSAAGTDPDSLVYKKQFNLLGATVTETSDGAVDGSLQGPQAKIIVEISVIPVNEVTVEFLEQQVQEFAAAAKILKETGIDCVELHCAHGGATLCCSFISPFYNHRTDQYGGNWENRLRLPTDIIRAMRDAVGDDYPVLARMDADELLGEDGITVSDARKYIAPALVEAGVDCLDVSWYHRRSLSSINRHYM